MDQRKCALLVDHTGTLHTEWKHEDCLNQLGELWTANIIISCCVCVCVMSLFCVDAYLSWTVGQCYMINIFLDLIFNICENNLDLAWCFHSLSF